MENHSLMHKISPAKCKEPWHSMPGTDVVRTCRKCKAKVYLVEGLDEQDLRELVSNAEPNKDMTKVKLFRRSDGKLMLTPGGCSGKPDPGLREYLTVLLFVSVGVAAVFVPVSAGLSAVMNGAVRANDDRERSFDPIVWKSNPKERQGMLLDLFFWNKLNGLTKEQVTAMLGEPDDKLNRPEYGSAETRPLFYWVRSAETQYGSLRVDFGKNGRVENASVPYEGS